MKNRAVIRVRFYRAWTMVFLTLCVLLLNTSVTKAQNFNHYTFKNIEVNIPEDSILHRSELTIDGKDRAKLFLEGQLYYFFDTNQQIKISGTELKKFIRGKELEIVLEGGRWMIPETSIRFDQNPDKITEEYLTTENLSNVFEKTITRNLIQILSLIGFILILKYFFPFYFSVLINPFVSVDSEVVSNFRNGSMVISSLISALVFNYLIIEYLNLTGILGYLILLVILTFLFLKFLLSYLIGKVFDNQELFISIYFSWLTNFLRISLIFGVLTIISNLLGVDFQLNLSLIFFIIVLFPILLSIITLFNRLKSLSLNYLFFYLCAAEIAPVVILTNIW